MIYIHNSITQCWLLSFVLTAYSPIKQLSAAQLFCHNIQIKHLKTLHECQSVNRQDIAHYCSCDHLTFYILTRWGPVIYIISYPLFADADTGIYPHAALQYHARPKAKRGIAMLSVDKFPYPRKQTRGNEFIPCSNNICDILKRFRSFKIPAITLIWPKSPYKHSVTRSYRSGRDSRRRSESPLWRHQWRSFVFISHADDVKREIRLHISRLLTNQKRESSRSMG